MLQKLLKDLKCKQDFFEELKEKRNEEFTKAVDKFNKENNYEEIAMINFKAEDNLIIFTYEEKEYSYKLKSNLKHVTQDCEEDTKGFYDFKKCNHNSYNQVAINWKENFDKIEFGFGDSHELELDIEKFIFSELEKIEKPKLKVVEKTKSKRTKK